MLKKLKILFVSLLVTTIFSGCALPGLGGSTGGKNIAVASQGTTEAELLAYILEGMLEHYIDTDVTIIDNMGSSSMIHEAINIGDANVQSAAYTGTSVTGELGMAAETDPEKALELVVEGYDELFKRTWFPAYGFNNTYAFMVTQETADKWDLEKVSDLEPYADQIKVGVDSTWINREGDGYHNFMETYGFEFPGLFAMSIGLVYAAVANNEVDVVLGYSTDGRIIAENLVVLEDDKQLFPPYEASPVATQQLLKEVPDAENVLLKLAGTIPNDKMQELNYRSDNFLLEPRTVAYQFLDENNYFEDKEPYLEPVEQKQGGNN